MNYVRSTLDGITQRLTSELMDWAPVEGMPTFEGQLVEIITVEIPLVAALKAGTETSETEIDKFIGTDRSLNGLCDRLTVVRQQTLGYLDSLSENDLVEEVSYAGPWFGSFWLPTLPRAEVFLNVAEHERYHVGQITSYLWARGDNPYHW